VNQRRLATLAIPLLAGSLALSACGSKKESSGGSSSTASDKTVTIGMIAPLSGSLSSLGLGMKNSAKLAIDQANAAGKIKGWKIVFNPQDDQEDPNTGAQAATKLSSDSSVVGVIGTLQSSIALQVAPILNTAKVVMISPSNTNPSLTQGKDYLTTKKRQFASYFRVCTTDSIQAPFAADYAYNTLKVKKAYLVNDKLVYGQGLTQNFATQFTKDGGKVITTDTVSQGQKDFGALVSKIKQAGPDIVYYGGQYPEGAPLAKQLMDAGVKAAFMGGDGLVDASFIKTLGVKDASAYATNVGAAVADLPNGQQFVDAYKAAGFSEPYGAYGPLTYDATNVMIDAIAKVLPGKTSIDDATKTAIIAAVQATDLSGVSGHVSFDEFGDTTTKTLTMYKVAAGDFTKQVTGTFNG
jgi:branched-chain amino acid transport system substrate-binding protein